VGFSGYFLNWRGFDLKSLGFQQLLKVPTFKGSLLYDLAKSSSKNLNDCSHTILSSPTVKGPPVNLIQSNVLQLGIGIVSE
jgi:hypothetical protein